MDDANNVLREFHGESKDLSMHRNCSMKLCKGCHVDKQIVGGKVGKGPWIICEIGRDIIRRTH